MKINEIPYVIYDTTGIYYSSIYGGKTSVLDNVDEDLEFVAGNVIDANNEFKYKGVLYSNVGDGYGEEILHNARFINHIRSKQPDLLIIRPEMIHLIDLVNPIRHIIVDMDIEESEYRINVGKKNYIDSITVNGEVYYKRPKCDCISTYDDKCDGCNHRKYRQNNNGLLPEFISKCVIRHNCELHSKGCINYRVDYKSILDKCVINCLMNIDPSVKEPSSCSTFLKYSWRISIRQLSREFILLINDDKKANDYLEYTYYVKVNSRYDDKCARCDKSKNSHKSDWSYNDDIVDGLLDSL